MSAALIEKLPFYTSKEESMEVLKWRELSMRTSEGRSRYCGEGVRVAGLYAYEIQNADSVCIDWSTSSI